MFLPVTLEVSRGLSHSCVCSVDTTDDSRSGDILKSSASWMDTQQSLRSVWWVGTIINSVGSTVSV